MNRSPVKDIRAKGLFPGKWGWALLLAVGIHLVGLGLFAPKQAEVGDQEKESFQILWSPEQAYSAEKGLQTLLQETSPLFLPGPWNAPMPGEVRLMNRRPEEPFPLHEAVIDGEVAALREGVGEVVPSAPEMRDVLTLPRQPFLHLWQKKSPRVELHKPSRKVVFRTVGTGEKGKVPDLDFIDPEDRPDSDSRPATVFRYHHSVTGPVGPLVLERGSGDEDLDRWRRNLLEQEVIPGLHLEPGYFFVEIGL